MKDSNDIQALRAKLQGTRGRTYWRSLEQVAETPNSRSFSTGSFLRTPRSGWTLSVAVGS
jgi:hypothetical protein